MCLCQQSLTSILTFKNRFDFDAILSYLNNLNNHKVKTIRAAAGQAAVSAMFLLPRIQTPPEKVRRKKKPVIAQCWIHRVLGSVTIIQRSSRNFMHEFLSCCLARILSAGWTQHCYAKCKKKTKWTKWTSWTTTACVSSCQHFCHPSHPTRQVLAHGAPTSLLISKRALRGTCKRGYGREMLGMLEVIKPNG